MAAGQEIIKESGIYNLKHECKIEEKFTRKEFKKIWKIDDEKIFRIFMFEFWNLIKLINGLFVEL